MDRWVGRGFQCRIQLGWAVNRVEMRPCFVESEGCRVPMLVISQGLALLDLRDRVDLLEAAGAKLTIWSARMAGLVFYLHLGTTARSTA